MNVFTAAVQDTTKSAAYVTRPSGPPDNTGYLQAAYGCAMAIYVGYVILLIRRSRGAQRFANAQGVGAGTSSDDTRTTRSR